MLVFIIMMFLIWLAMSYFIQIVYICTELTSTYKIRIKTKKDAILWFIPGYSSYLIIRKILNGYNKLD